MSGRPGIRAAMLLLAALLGGCGPIIDRVGGDFAGRPAEMDGALTPGARELIARAFEGIDSNRLADFHVHVFGQGPDGDGPSVTPTVRSWLHPFRMLQYRVYLSAAGITDETGITGQYVERLVDLVRNIDGHGRYFIYAMDRHYLPDGTPDQEATPFYVPNDYVFSLAGRYPAQFVPVISIHPYRKDALQELEKWAGKGCRYVKWLTTSQGIDPSSPQTEPFYRTMRKYGMVLLVHTGEELAVFSGKGQSLGNPLLLRAPLDSGVTVVALHSASYGKHVDLDSPGREKVPSFDLFLRLMDEPRYQGLLYGEIAGVTFFNHSAQALETLLARDDLHPRLVNGSDYPLPAINFLVMTGRLVRHGFITREERRALNEIYRYNPLLFDFVLKRTLRHPETGRRFPPSLFMVPAGFP
ncbi:MAG: amidohydrolase family protein [Geobacteraceae bacterium]|nr:amidohydrolase family protein [Geobacteraceae bacterium]